MLSTITPAAGRLLVSEPFMMDPAFKRSVIIITEYSEAGAMGFILNQQSENLIGDLIADVSYSDLPVYIGGPVSNDTLHFIHRCPEKIDDGIEISNGIFWGGNFEQVKNLVNTYQLKAGEIKFFTGYSGWMGGQLQNELKEDSWIVSEKYNADLLFASDENNLWKEVVIGLGQRFAHIANFPENPTLN